MEFAKKDPMIFNHQQKQFHCHKMGIWRRIHFLKQNNIERTFNVNILEFQKNYMFDISKILQSLRNKGLTLSHQYLIRTGTNKKIFHQNFFWVDINYFHEKDLYFQDCETNDTEMEDNLTEDKEKETLLNQNIKIQQQSLFQAYQNQNQYKYQKKQKEHKKMKEPQRKIGDVIRQVKYWRILNEVDSFTLAEAAKIIGVPKKSLDDYYLVLRIGQNCGYDFSNNLQNGFGRLRAYTKKYYAKKQGRLPKQISNYKMFDLIQYQNLIKDDSFENSFDDSLWLYKVEKNNNQ